MQINRLFEVIHREKNNQENKAQIDNVDWKKKRENIKKINAAVKPSADLERQILDYVNKFDMNTVLTDAKKEKPKKPDTCTGCKNKFKNGFWRKEGTYCEQEEDWFCDTCICPSSIFIPRKVSLSDSQCQRLQFIPYFAYWA